LSSALLLLALPPVVSRASCRDSREPDSDSLQPPLVAWLNHINQNKHFSVFETHPIPSVITIMPPAQAHPRATTSPMAKKPATSRPPTLRNDRFQGIFKAGTNSQQQQRQPGKRVGTPQAAAANQQAHSLSIFLKNDP